MRLRFVDGTKLALFAVVRKRFPVGQSRKDRRRERDVPFDPRWNDDPVSGGVKSQESVPTGGRSQKFCVITDRVRLFRANADDNPLINDSAGTGDRPAEERACIHLSESIIARILFRPAESQRVFAPVSFNSRSLLSGRRTRTRNLSDKCRVFSGGIFQPLRFDQFIEMPQTERAFIGFKRFGRISIK